MKVYLTLKLAGSLLLALICCCFFISQASAEVASTEATSFSESSQLAVPKGTEQIGELIMGRSPADLNLLLGPPDVKSVKRGKNSETWRYGKSTVFFEDSMAVAFIDTGELALRKLSRPGGERLLLKARDFRLLGWINPWTHQGVSEKTVIESILK